MRLIRWLISLPIFVAVIVFALQNRFQVPISFWPFDAEVTMPVSILSLGLLLIGFVLGTVVTGFTTFRSVLEARKLRAKLEKLEAKAKEEGGCAPVACEPTILYKGRYQPVSTLEKKTAPRPRWSRWFKGA